MWSINLYVPWSLQDLPLGLMDDIYDFITKFPTRIDEVEEVSGKGKSVLSVLQAFQVPNPVCMLHIAFNHIIMYSVGAVGLYLEVVRMKDKIDQSCLFLYTYLCNSH